MKNDEDGKIVFVLLFFIDSKYRGFYVKKGGCFEV